MQSNKSQVLLMDESLLSLECVTKPALAGSSINRRTVLHIIQNGILSAQMYADEIQRLHLINYAVPIRGSFLLTQNNVRHHTARLEENFLEAETTQVWRTSMPS
ncbi:hypothetical protein TNCV_1956501 [Trichonephila clavipes]|nr:hypothetical protein TNCV_1956501 [Trichonephila clavipes]